VTGAIFRLILRLQATRGRLAALGVLGAVVVLVGLSIGLAVAVRDQEEAGAVLVDTFGLSLFAPVATLVIAAAALGDPAEDGTLVYLWLRPVPRVRIVLGAYLATLAVSLPIVLVPLVAAAALSGGGSALIAGTAAAAAVGVVAYSGVFLALGLRVRRALVWGLAYVLLWEGFVASAGGSAARLAIRAYTRSILSEATGVTLRLATLPLAVAVLVPILVAVAAAFYTVRRLHRQDIA
jgi:ABC-2 type transport system permease protein